MEYMHGKELYTSWESVTRGADLWWGVLLTSFTLTVLVMLKIINFENIFSYLNKNLKTYVTIHTHEHSLWNSSCFLLGVTERPPLFFR